MKSDFVVGDSSKLESRQSVGIIRRMSKQSSVVNGKLNANEGDSDCSVNMVAAIQDHISCTKSADLLKIQEAREDKVALACELDHMYANCGEPKFSPDESQPIRQLKELLFFHLDLIQERDEQLKAKDRQLTELKEEKQSLKQQLDRVERCRTIMKQKEKANVCEQQHPNTSETINHDEQNWLEMPSSLTSSVKSPNSLGERKLKRKSSIEATTCKRKSDLEVKTESVEVNSNSNNDLETLNQEDESGAINNTPVKKSFLQTESPYFSNYNSMISSPESPPRDEDVLVPSWRLHPVTSCYQLEGTENLDDEVFLKRHQKLEIDERRRKRWDIQRIREQRMNEKLKRGRSANKEDNLSPDIDAHSFFPNPEDAQYLEVSDTVPVCAFGYPVPNFQPCEFTLPIALLNSETEKTSVKRSSRLRSSTSKMQRTSDVKHES